MGFMDLFKSNKLPTAVSFQDILDAQARIAPYLTPTPLTFSPQLSDVAQREVFVKWENKLRTGSFKERGALNFLLSLTPDQKKSGVCAASAGNHALALSYYAAKLNIQCHLIMPVSAPLVKVAAARKTGAEIILFGTTFNEAYERAQKIAAEKNYAFVPAFDHPMIIAGQGTAGLEICSQIDDFDSVVVPVGGGGLIAGISIAIKERKREVFVLGAQSEWAVSHRAAPLANAGSLAAVTIADGIAVKRIGAHNAPIIEKNVDKLIAVSESDIARAILQLLQLEKTVVEGAGAAGLAALLNGSLPCEKKKTVVVVSGSNIDLNLLSRLIDREMAASGRLIKIMVSVPDAPGSLHETTGIIAKSGANVLQVFHDRSFSELPGNVDVSFLLEIRDDSHKKIVLKALDDMGLAARQI